jgi:hypothetical protein
MDDEGKKNIFSIVKDGGKKKKELPRINLYIEYADGTADNDFCHWYGESIELPGLFIFGDDRDDGVEMPKALINTEYVKRINIKVD